MSNLWGAINMKLTHPVIWPVEQRRRGYSKSNPRHEGTDYGWRTPHPTESRRILAAAPGRVTRVIDGGGWNQGWGNLVEIQHTTGAKTTYNHLRTGGIRVKVGATVKAGEHIATMGTTGDSTGDHLHWELWLLKSGAWTRVNPESYLSKNLPGTDIIKPSRKANERDVATPNGSRVRTGPGLHFDTTGIALHGWRKPFSGFVRGEEVNGSDVWLIYPDGGFTHLSGWIPQNTEALVDVTPVPEPVEPEPEPEPENHIEEKPMNPVTPDAPPTSYPTPTESQEQKAVEIGQGLLSGQYDVAGWFHGRVRTIVPIVVGPLLAWLVTLLPQVAEFLDAQFDGWQELVLGGISALLAYGYWSLAGWLGKRWPAVEKFMLGSSKKPVYLDPKK